jgi:hypothetical protein
MLATAIADPYNRMNLPGDIAGPFLAAVVIQAFIAKKRAKYMEEL